MLRLAHHNLQAVRFPEEEVIDDLLRPAARKLVKQARDLAVNLIDTSDLEYGYMADLGVDVVNRKKGVLHGARWEALGSCTITPEWCLHIPNYSRQALFTSSEKHFFVGM